MPEYLYPGVYLDETNAGARTIPGVSTSPDDAMLQSLAADFRRAMQGDAPAWTDSSDFDPGITLLEIFAFLSESLLYRANQIPERGRSAALRAATALAAIAYSGEGCCQSLKRPSFFSGQFLDAATLAAEQDYQREKLRRHNRALLGNGVVSGLAVRVEAAPDGTGWRVVIESGYAIDSNGEEISVPCRVTVSAPAQGDSAFVTLRFWEHPCSPVPTADGGSVAPAAIEEACIIGISPDVVSPAVPLARLIRGDGGWQLDMGFTPQRARTEGQSAGG